LLINQSCCIRFYWTNICALDAKSRY
jgi:hypothetical protein